MEQIIKIDDAALLSKHIIKSKDVMALLPEDVKGQVKDIRVMVDHGQPRWVVFLKSGGCYHYEPLNKDHEMIFDASGVKPAYGKIYFCRKARVLRYEDTPEPRENKYYPVFLCRPHTMIFVWEIKEWWYYQTLVEGPGCSTYCKWFRHFDV